MSEFKRLHPVAIVFNIFKTIKICFFLLLFSFYFLDEILVLADLFNG